MIPFAARRLRRGKKDDWVSGSGGYHRRSGGGDESDAPGLQCDDVSLRLGKQTSQRPPRGEPASGGSAPRPPQEGASEQAKSADPQPPWTPSRHIDWLGSFIVTKLYDIRSPLGVPLLMVVAALLPWGLSVLAGSLASPLSDGVLGLASWLPGASVALALSICLAAERLLTFPLLMTHTREDPRTGKLAFGHKGPQGRSYPPGRIVTSRLVVVLVDMVALHLMARTLEGIPTGGQWLLFADLGNTQTFIYSIGMASGVFFAMAYGSLAFQEELLPSASRRIPARGPRMARRMQDRGIWAYILVCDCALYLPAIAGLCAVHHGDPYVFTLVASFLLIKLLAGGLASALSTGVDCWRDWRQPGSSAGASD